METVTPSRLTVYDPGAEGEPVKKGGVWVREIGAWVDAPHPTKEAKQLARNNKELQEASASAISGENPHGTFGDKANASVLLRQSQQRQPRRKLDIGTARKILNQAGGDRERAKQIARQMGYDDEVD